MTEIRPKSQIIRATGIIGGASIINMAMGLLRTKVAAVLLGAAGIGLIGILHSFMTTAATLASWGISNTAALTIAGAADEKDRARGSVRWVAAGLALIGTAATFLLRKQLAEWLFEDTHRAGMIGVIALGVGLTVLANSQTGVLTGFKRVGDLGRASAVSAVVTTLMSVPVLLFMRDRAVLPYVMLAPLVTLAAGTFYVHRLPAQGRASAAPLAAQWRKMLSLGTALTIGSVIAMGGQLAVRVILQRKLGLGAVGLFSASYAISANYIALALGALSADYYPRLVPHIAEPGIVRRLVNDQAVVALLLAAPIIVLVIGWAPIVTSVLYAPSFRPAAEILRWQLIGDVLKLVNWPLGYVLIASGRGRSFALNEALANTAGIGALLLLLPWMGVAAAGAAYLAQQGAYALNLHLLVRRQLEFSWETQTLRYWCLVSTVAVAALFASSLGFLTGMCFSTLAAVVVGIAAFRHLQDALPRRFTRLFQRRSRTSGDQL